MYGKPDDLLERAVQLLDVVADLIVPDFVLGLSLATAAGFSQLFSP
jgi:hypothetical protein